MRQRNAADRNAGEFPTRIADIAQTTRPAPGEYSCGMDEPDQSDVAERFPFDAIYKALCCHRQAL